MAIVYMDTKHHVIKCEVCNEGTVNQVVIYVREIAKQALLCNATAVIMAHNHPSGETTPSEADIRLTSRVSAGLGTLDMKLLDHIIIADAEYFSFTEEGIL